MIRQLAAYYQLPEQSRCWFKVAEPFIVHGHRLSSLYRSSVITSKSFIVLKILKKLKLFLEMKFEYLRNNDGRGVGV